MRRLGILLAALVLTLPLLAIGLGKMAVDLWRVRRSMRERLRDLRE